MDAANALHGHAARAAGPERPRPRDPRVRAPVVEVRRRQGDRGPREVRHVVDPLLPGPQRADRPPGGARGRPAPGPPAAPAARRPPAAALGPSPRLRGLRTRADPATSAASRSPRPSPSSASSPSPWPAITYVATQGEEPTEREVTTVRGPRHDARARRPRRSARSSRRSPRRSRAAGRARRGLRRGLQQLRDHRPGRPGRRHGGRGRLAGRRLRQLVRHHPRSHGLLPAAAQGGGAAGRDLGIGRVEPAVGAMRRVDRLTVHR